MNKGQKEIMWNIVNAGIAGGLVFAGAFADGEITLRGVMAALSAALIITLTKFQKYWKNDKENIIKNIFNFI